MVHLAPKPWREWSRERFGQDGNAQLDLFDGREEESGSIEWRESVDEGVSDEEFDLSIETGRGEFDDDIFEDAGDDAADEEVVDEDGERD
ncbi:MAG: hypothetical protein M1835_005526, partial [Candelina submexicana]